MIQVSIDHAASIIGVSTATIRNWVKAGHLNPAQSRPIYFFEQDVIHLRTKIYSGQLPRLRSRANKTASTARPLVQISADASHSSRIAKTILEVYHRGSFDISAVMYFCALRLLELAGELTLNKPFGGVDFGLSIATAKRSAISHCMTEWKGLLGGIEWASGYHDIYSSIDHIEDDILGAIYQLLTAEGDRSNKGAYYTPMSVIEASLNSIEQPQHSFLDPCCGSGRYLMQAAKVLHIPISAIYGFDTDAIVVQIAKINLLLQFRDANCHPNIFCLDSIADVANGELLCSTNHLIGSFDCIATNPPWGSYKNSTKNGLSNKIASNESFSLFLEKGLHLLRSGGRLSFILPESILKTKTHQDVRSLILETSKILRIVKLGRPFNEVFTNVIRLDIIKDKPEPDWAIRVESGEKLSAVQQSCFLKNDSFSFDIDIESIDEVILKKLYATPHMTLKGNADWALGIVTGNNEKYVKNTYEAGMEPVLRGSDVLAFGIKSPTAFLHFTPQAFQQVAKQNLYRAPSKLIYKFISSRLAFAFDDKQMLTLNSANILIPRMTGSSIKTTLAFLNSDVFQYIFKKKFSTHKVLRGDLETMPFPVITQDVNAKIEALVEKLIGGRPCFDDIQKIIFSLFDLSDSDVFAIKKAVRD